MGFADGVEHYAIEMRQRALGRGFGLTDSRPGAVGRHGPGQQRPEAPAIGRRFAEVFQDADGTDGRADADVRVQLASSDADAGSRGSQSSLGLPHIGTAFEQGGAVTDRQQLRNLWQLRAAIGADRQLIHRFGQQHRQPEQPRLTRRLITRHVGAQGFELGL